MCDRPLQAMGYAVTLCVGPEGKSWAAAYGFDMIELESFEKLVNEDDGIRNSAETGDLAAFFAALSATMCQTGEKEVPLLGKAIAADKSAVAIVATSTHSTLTPLIAKKCGIAGCNM